MHVVATAGHVDHGKSALVRALTGMEPDRWAEEQRRGLTIDLGFAWLTLPSGEQLAFVDVPGHERFVPNMLAGVGPVPAVMFVVAADGGWMPQSEEHLLALDALGISNGLLVVTRADLADPGPALAQARRRIEATSLGEVEACAVSAVTGAGADALIAALDRMASRVAQPAPEAPVRLWIDRVFTIRGSGTVVTGTLPAGTVGMRDELAVAPGGRVVRIRGVQSLKQSRDRVCGVARVALNLRGVEVGSLERGMALVTPGGWTPTSQIDVRIGRTPAAPGAQPGAEASPDRDGAPSRGGAAAPPREVTVHIGAARTSARIRMLGPSTARLTLAGALPLHVGDRLLLRMPGAFPAAGGPAAGARRESWPPLVGATVLDVAPPPLRGRGAAAAAGRELSAWPALPTAEDLLRRHGLLRAPAVRAMGVTGYPEPVCGPWLADPGHWSRLRARLIEVVAGHAQAHPLAAGMPIEAARAALGLPERRVVEALIQPPLAFAEGVLTARPTASPRSPAAGAPSSGPARARSSADGGSSAGVGSSAGAGLVQVGAAVPGAVAPAVPGAAGSGSGLPEGVLTAVRAVLGDLAKSPFVAPEADRLRELGLDSKALAAASRARLLLRVGEAIVLAPGADTRAAQVLAGLPQPFTTAQARQALGTTRRVAIPLLEYLDRAGVTRRLPDDRRQLARR